MFNFNKEYIGDKQWYIQTGRYYVGRKLFNRKTIPFTKTCKIHFDSLVNHNEILTNYSYGEKHGLMHFSALWSVGE